MLYIHYVMVEKINLKNKFDWHSTQKRLGTVHNWVWDWVLTGYETGYFSRKSTHKTMNVKKKKERDRIYEKTHPKERIDRRDPIVTKFVDEAKKKTTVSKAIRELIIENSQLKAQLRANELDIFDDVTKICSAIFKNMLSGARPAQLELWMAAFKRRFMKSSLKELEKYGNVEDLKEKDHLQRTIEMIEKMERDTVDAHLRDAIMIKGKS